MCNSKLEQIYFPITHYTLQCTMCHKKNTKATRKLLYIATKQILLKLYYTLPIIISNNV